MNLSLKGDFEQSFVKKGDVIFREGDVADKMFLVSSGKVICFKRLKEEIIPIYTVDGKGVLGEECLFSGEATFPYYAVAIESAQISKIPKKMLSSYLDNTNEWIRNILADIASKIHQTRGLIIEHKIIDDKFVGGGYLSEEDKVLLKKATVSKV